MSGFNKNSVKCKLKKGDEVVVLVGRDRGRKGKVEHIDRKHGTIVVESINVYKRHVKANERNPEGGIIDKAMPLDISNVALVDPKQGVATRVGYKIEDGKKLRIAKKSGTVLS